MKEQYYEIHLTELLRKDIVKEIMIPSKKHLKKESKNLSDNQVKSQIDEMFTSLSKKTEEKIVLIDKIKKEYKEVIQKEKMIENDHEANIFNSTNSLQNVFENTINEESFVLKVITTNEYNQKQEIIKECKNIEEILKALDVNKDIIKSDSMKEYIISDIIDNFPNNVKEENKIKIDGMNKKFKEKILKNPNYYNTISPQKGVEYLENDFLTILLKKAFDSINQNTISKEALHQGLMEYYLQRFTIGNLSNVFLKIECKVMEFANVLLNFQKGMILEIEKKI